MDPTPARPLPSRGKYLHIAFCFLPQTIFVLLALGPVYRGYWFLLPVIFLLLIVPLLDTVTGWQDEAHFEPKAFSRPDKFLFRWNTRLYAIFYLASVVLATRYLSRLTIVAIAFLLA